MQVRHAKRGLAYQCMKCLPKMVIWELSRMKSHHYKEHWSADNFPHFCSLCTYRCHTLGELISHEACFGPHIDARRAAVLKNDFKGDPAYRKKGNRVRTFNQDLHDLDFVALSREQSARYWATRARTVPPTIRSSAPVTTPVQSLLVGQVSNPQQMAYARPVVPNSQMFSDQAVWSVPAQPRARQQPTASVSAPPLWQSQVPLPEFDFTEVPIMPILQSQQPMSVVTQSPEPSTRSPAHGIPLSYLESFLPIAVNSSPDVSVATQQPLPSTCTITSTAPPAAEESVNVLDQILFDGEEMFMESSPPPRSVITEETLEDSDRKVVTSEVELSNHATVLESLQTVTSTNSLLTQEVSSLSQEVKLNTAKNTTLSSDVSYLRGQIRQQERLLARQQSMLRSILNILQAQQRQKPKTFRNSARTRLRPYNLPQKRESSPKPAVRSIVKKKDC